MKVYHSDLHALHAPAFEIFDGGEKIPSFETPERVERILQALRADGRFEILPPEQWSLDPIRAVHDEGYLTFLETAFTDWMREPTDYEKTALLPSTFALSRRAGRVPASILGRAGYYMMDLSAPIVAGTWQAALASAHCALSAARLISSLRSAVQTSVSAFALCRPPGHHAGRAFCGGYCYINNAAVAAHWLTQFGNVALLDVDYHAANGTQDIFYERADVLTLSIHADPAEEYPYYWGYADETGAGEGKGYHQNFPLPFGVDDTTYLKTLERALERIATYRPAFLVLSAGMDIYGQDPLGRIRVTTAGIAEIGRQIAALALPAVVVLEGGYHNAALGTNLLAFLEAFHAA
ncbi:MAG: histone deacetylase family protein [Anaerolineales bacterium]|nr:histone deacetylase family protein [Anaerolineales bacterium]